jgi:CHASE2 domain-containing sensor protein
VKSFDNSIEDEDIAEGEFPYGTFIAPDRFNQCSAGHILNASVGELKRKFQHHIVMVGGVWHGGAYGYGDQVDQHPSPIGWVPGVYLHANYVEAMISRQTFSPIPAAISYSIEIFMALAVAIIFALEYRLRWKVLSLLILVPLLVLTSYFAMQNLGMFFDFFIPLVLVFCHAMVAQVLEWRKAASLAGISIEQ